MQLPGSGQGALRRSEEILAFRQFAGRNRKQQHDKASPAGVMQFLKAEFSCRSILRIAQDVHAIQAQIDVLAPELALGIREQVGGDIQLRAQNTVIRA
jgi:hypothetical protein